jgi:antagonist of KipI
MSIDVIKPGLFSTFQDLGRVGYQQLGVPVSGAMDEVSHRVANLLVGNGEGEATLEITLLGPVLRFQRSAWIALCGADLGAAVMLPSAGGVAGISVALGTPTWITAGSTLQFGKRRSGLRSYLAVRGGFDLPLVMGSRSTHVRGGIGGFEGRALRKGDVLPLRVAAPEGAIAAPLSPAVRAALSALRDPEPGAPIRVTKGREWHHFTPEAQAAFLSQPAVISAQSERMALRLQGPALTRSVSGDMLSEAVAFGTVQVPPEGQPIVLMADRQSSGGYPRIAQVASVDLPRLAQTMPGESLRFELVELAAAQHLLLQRAQHLASLRSALGGASDDLPAIPTVEGSHA